MKFLIVFALIVAASAGTLPLNDEQKAKVHGYAATCVEKEGITKEQAMALREGKFDNVDAKSKCFANCFLEQVGFLSDGAVQEAVITKKLGDLVGAETIAKVQTKCNSIKGADKCDTAFQLYQCYYKENAVL